MAHVLGALNLARRLIAVLSFSLLAAFGLNDYDFT
jgi:hypothetical protein